MIYGQGVFIPTLQFAGEDTNLQERIPTIQTTQD